MQAHAGQSAGFVAFADTGHSCQPAGGSVAASGADLRDLRVPRPRSRASRLACHAAPGLASLLASKPCSEQGLVLAMVAQRLIAPATKLTTARLWQTRAQKHGRLHGPPAPEQERQGKGISIWSAAESPAPEWPRGHQLRQRHSKWNTFRRPSNKDPGLSVKVSDFSPAVIKGG